MQLLELLNLANTGYDGGLAEFYDEKTGDVIDRVGDTLAVFIVGELISNYETGLGDEAQILDAIHTMTVAKNELESVIIALESRSGSDLPSLAPPPRLRAGNGHTAL